MNGSVTNPVGLKYERGYLLTVANKARQTVAEIRIPFTIEFDISRANYGSTNFANIEVYNLGENTRRVLQLDPYAQLQNLQGLVVTLQAGYGSNSRNWPVVFSGVANWAYSVRRGTEFITTIQAFDAGQLQTAFTAIDPSNAPVGTKIRDVIKKVIGGLNEFGIKTGAIGNFEGVIEKSQSFFGKTTDVLDQLTNSNFFIDLQYANAILPTESLENVIVLSPRTGLLETPLKSKTWIEIETLFEPGAVVGGLATIQSATSSLYNNLQYEICSVQHTGMISASVAGKVTTKLGLRGGTFTKIAREVGL